jgi:SUN domain-containing protein 1/2
VEQDKFSSLDVSKIVADAIKVYDADKTGMFDFALESAGGTIANTRCTEPYDLSNAIYSLWGIPFWWESNNARTILQPGSSPGQCWAFKGSQGSVVVRLSQEVDVRAVSMEHISKMAAPDNSISSAPRNFAVFGLESVDDVSPVSLGNFTYMDSGDPVQEPYDPYLNCFYFCHELHLPKSGGIRFPWHQADQFCFSDS